MIDNFYYDIESRNFSKTPGLLTYMKGKLPFIATSALLAAVPAVISAYRDHYDKKAMDQILRARNTKLNELYDNYNSGMEISKSKDSYQKYKKVLTELVENSLKYAEYRDTSKDKFEVRSRIDDTTQITQYKDKNSILYSYIIPFIVAIRLALVNGVHILMGSKTGVIRRDFELVFAPDQIDTNAVAKDSFRMTIFKYKWPVHGFESSTLGADEANNLMSATIDFLAKNPKYLAIRVK